MKTGNVKCFCMSLFRMTPRLYLNRQNSVECVVYGALNSLTPICGLSEI